MVFDVGETLIDDTTFWGSWANWLNVPHHTLAALVGHVTAEGRNNADALALVKPGFDLATERSAREAAGCGEHIDVSDLYPDARPALTALRAAGLWVGVAGNQTARAGELLRELDLPVDAIATSGEWGLAKPDLRFFKKISEWSGFPTEQIAYVGDHPENDIISARAAGLRPAHLRRGPWGYRYADDPAVRAAAEWHVDSLHDLVDALKACR
ncbi:HAD family hydrolase [Actinospica robiniae]|uniref:HAD family hydrolase n=1 Tax=Actinospica robiniae TaxID=304901 RepID=UPI0004133D47|nr:HAD family hydrolase [Actinospica robiniae]